MITRKNIRGWILIPLSPCLLQACSNQQVYDAIQQNRQFECQKLPGSQYEECMEQFSEPYEDYERERQELLEEKPDHG